MTYELAVLALLTGDGALLFVTCLYALVSGSRSGTDRGHWGFFEGAQLVRRKDRTGIEPCMTTSDL
jgi:hypothetical protein